MLMHIINIYKNVIETYTIIVYCLYSTAFLGAGVESVPPIAIKPPPSSSLSSLYEEFRMLLLNMPGQRIQLE